MIQTLVMVIRKLISVCMITAVILTSAPVLSRIHGFMRRTVWKEPVAEMQQSVIASRTSRYDRIIQRAAERYGMDENLIRAVIIAESRFDQHLVSSAGARGLMQLMPETAGLLGVRDIFDPEENIMAGTRFLQSMLVMFESDLTIALAAYNAGPNRVKEWGYTIPPIVETRAYVAKVLRIYRQLAEHDVIHSS